MSEELKLTTVPISDENVLAQCRETLNKWTASMPFAITRRLGDESEPISATLYHSYSLRVETNFVTREFKLKKGGSPRTSPVNVRNLDMWKISSSNVSGDFDKALDDTCYSEKCRECGGAGETKCGSCNGRGKVSCTECGGRGEIKCHHCGGRGKEDCGACNGTGKVSRERMVNCSHCHGTGQVRSVGNSGSSADQGWMITCSMCDGKGQKSEYYYDSCSHCGGSGKETCSSCRGSGKERCDECGGSGVLTCDTCDGSGVITCDSCDGRGWNAYTWHLIQEDKTNKFNVAYGDSGAPAEHEFAAFSKYQTRRLFGQSVKGGAQIPQSNFPKFEAPFVSAILEKWNKESSKYIGRSDLKILSQVVEFCQHDTLIRYEYKFRGKEYLVWIDLVKGEAFESGERGLMTEWQQQIVADADKCGFTNPQKAIHLYSMASAIRKDDETPAKKLMRRLSLGSWLFRLAAFGTAGWLWSRFFVLQGAVGRIGWMVAGAMAILDLFFARKSLVAQVVGGLAVYGLAAAGFSKLLSFLGFADVYMQPYLMSAVLMFVGGSLLFARDFALRMRGGVLVFPLMGALVAAVSAPCGVVDFSDNPESTVRLLTFVAYGICGLAIVRTFSRLWLQNFPAKIKKSRAWRIRFEVNSLKPRFLATLTFILLFGGVGYWWYLHAGPGVGAEVKCRAAERFLADERTVTKGLHYLVDAADSEYPRAMGRLAEITAKGLFGVSEDPKAGYAKAVEASEKGDAVGWRTQGYCLEYGRGVDQNLTAANARYARATELGDVEAAKRKDFTAEIAKHWELAHSGDKDAEYGLSICYADGTGIAKDDATARKWLLKAADGGNLKAQVRASDWLIKGIGGRKDPDAGVAYCEKAARQGDPDAIAVLGYYYFDGKIIPQNYPKAIESFQLACDKGSGSAAYMLGYSYKNGLGSEKNLAKAIEYFRLGASRSNAPAQYALAAAHENGDGVAFDYTEALMQYALAASVKWEDSLTGKSVADAEAGVKRLAEIGKYWRLANEEGNSEAQCRVGCCFADGNGVKADEAAAYKWFVKSAEQGYLDGIVRMADALFSGKGVKEDKAAAAKAYERGHKDGNVHSTFMLASSYENGWGGEKNLSKAYTLYLKASEGNVANASNYAARIAVPAKYWNAAMIENNASAQYALACCYLRGGCGLDRDEKKAFELFKSAAAAGDSDALYMIGLCYRDGLGTEKDDGARRDAFKAAADKNHAAACAVLGDMCRDGDAEGKDYTAALALYERALKGGIDSAKESASQIDKVGKIWSSAVKGVAKAEFGIGLCYRDGIQVSVDRDAARAWFEKAASKGLHEAEYALAELLSRDPKCDEQTWRRIVDLLQKAAAAGHVKAKVMLGRCLYEGKGIKEDYDRAVEMWQELSKGGDLDAKCALAGFHYTGRGLFNSGKDQNQAVKEWTEAADAGHIESAARVGHFYLGGSGMFGSGKDLTKARQYLLIAANAGNRDAMVDLAELLDDSSDANDKAKSKEWLWKSKATPQAKQIRYSVTLRNEPMDIAAKTVTNEMIEMSKEADDAIHGIKKVEKEPEPVPQETVTEGTKEEQKQDEPKVVKVNENDLGMALGDASRKWNTDWRPKQDGVTGAWKVSPCGDKLGRESYVGSTGSGDAEITSLMSTSIEGPCHISFEYRIANESEDAAIVMLGDDTLILAKGTEKNSSEWKTFRRYVGSGKRDLMFAQKRGLRYSRGGNDSVNQVRGFFIANFAVKASDSSKKARPSEKSDSGYSRRQSRNR